MFDKIKSLFGEKPKAKTSTNSASPTPRVKAKEPEKTAKEIANEKDEPYVSVLGLELDADNLHQGAFELDWNEKFVANLIRAGYVGKTDADIVDQWFQNVCRHVVMETWEQEQAMNPTRFTRSRDLGDGRTEVS